MVLVQNPSLKRASLSKHLPKRELTELRRPVGKRKCTMPVIET